MKKLLAIFLLLVSANAFAQFHHGHHFHRHGGGALVLVRGGIGGRGGDLFAGSDVGIQDVEGAVPDGVRLGDPAGRGVVPRAAGAAGHPAHRPARAGRR